MYKKKVVLKYMNYQMMAHGLVLLIYIIICEHSNLIII